MDHLRLDLDANVDDAYASGSSAGSRGVVVPIEVKLRLLSVKLLYEVCRVQKLSLSDLGAWSCLSLFAIHERPS